MSFYITIEVYPIGPKDYGINMDTNIHDEDIILKILKDAVALWDQKTVTEVE